MKINKISCLAALLPLASPLAVQASEVEISGLLETEIGFGSDFNDVDSSDITLATVELAFDAMINERVSAHVLMLHEDDDTEPAEIDEGIIGLDLTNGWSLEAGRMYVPFGSFETRMVSDPLTLEIGETREAAILVGYEAQGFYGAACAFNGDTIETTDSAAGEDTIEHFGASFGYLWESGEMALDVGVDYINSIGDSDGVYENLTLQDADGDGTPEAMQSLVSGTALHAIYTQSALSVIFEYVASDDFDAADLDFNGAGASIIAYNLEAGYDFGWGVAAVGYQGTEEAVNLGLPESRILVAVSKEIFEGTTLGFEHAMDDDYSTADGGTGNDASTTTLQLAVEF